MVAVAAKEQENFVPLLYGQKENLHKNENVSILDQTTQLKGDRSGKEVAAAAENQKSY